MKNFSFLLALLCGFGVVLPAQASKKLPPAQVGLPAPDFSLPASDGKNYSLSQFKGKYVVLEWTNPECPFVHKFYDGGTMQKLQKEETTQGTVWLRINSSGSGLEGYQTASEAADYEKKNQVASTATLLDANGEVGRHLYHTRTTPHLFIIDPKGILIYAGGIDNTPSAEIADVAGATNYVQQAFAEIRAGKPISTPTSLPYGCSVKYAPSPLAE